MGYSAQEDALNRFLRGRDPSGFREIVESYRGLIFGVCLRILGDRQEAEDATQETFLHLFRARARRIRNPRAWLARIARNVSLDLRRQRERRLVETLASEAVMASTTGQDIASRLEIWESIQSLPPDLRDCVHLRFYEGFEIREIAQALGCHRNTVRNHLNEARRRLQIALAPAIAGLVLSQLDAPQAIGSPFEPSPSLEAALTSLAERIRVAPPPPAHSLLSGIRAVRIGGGVLAAALAAGLFWWGLRQGGGPEDERDDAAVATPGAGEKDAARREGERQAAVSPERGADPNARPVSTSVRLSGRVTDPRGVPLAGVTIWFDPEAVFAHVMTPGLPLEPCENVPAKGETDRDGHYTLDIPLGEAPLLMGVVCAISPGYVFTGKSVLVDPDESAKGIDLGDLIMGIGLGVAGRVRTTTGLPVAGAHVVMVEAGDATTTDETGAYRLPATIPSGFPWHVEAAAPGFATAHREVSGGAPSIEPLAIDFELSPEALVTGRVVSRDGGDPVPDARIGDWRDPGIPRLACIADVEGRFEIHGLPAESVGPFFIHGFDFHPRIVESIRGGTRDLVIEVEPCLTIEVEAAFSSGKRMPIRPIRVQDPRGALDPDILRIVNMTPGYVEDGTALICGLQSGTYVIEGVVKGSGRHTVEFTFDEERGPKTLKIPLGEEVVIRGTIRIPEDRRHVRRGFGLRLFRFDPDAGEWTDSCKGTDVFGPFRKVDEMAPIPEDGTFAFEGLAPGRYTIRLWSMNDGIRHLLAIEEQPVIEAGGPGTFETTLVGGEGGSIEGPLPFGLREPVQGLEARAIHGDGFVHPATIRPDNTFLATALPAGRWIVVLQRRGARTYRVADREFPIELEPGGKATYAITRIQE